MSAAINLEGQRFGRWIVLYVGEPGADRALRWVCRCDCGTVRAVRAQHLRSGRSTTCGCSRFEINITHGHARAGHRHELYDIWKSIIQRCTNPRNRRYPDYGGRGIAICAAWRESFEAFLEGVGERPSRAYSIDRIDNDRGYEPGNVRWATRFEQARNTRKNKRKV